MPNVVPNLRPGLCAAYRVRFIHQELEPDKHGRKKLSRIVVEFLSDTLALLDYTTFLPNSPFWSAWSEAYYLGIQAVESGDLTPEEAIDVVVDQMQNELGDNVIIQE